MTSGLRGWRVRVMPRCASASFTALTTAAGAPMAPPSPIPLKPPGRADGVTMWPYSNSGVSGAVGQQVVEERRGERVADVVVDELLVQHAADALHDAPGDLAFDDHRVDHDAAVLAHDVAQERDQAGVGVDLARADVRGIRERGADGREAGRDLEPGRRAVGKLARPQVGELRDLGQRSRRARRAPHRDHAMLDVEVVDRQLPSRARRSRAHGRASRARSDGRHRHRRPRCGCRRWSRRAVTLRCRRAAR